MTKHIPFILLGTYFRNQRKLTEEGVDWGPGKIILRALFYVSLSILTEHSKLNFKQSNENSEAIRSKRSSP